MDLALSIAVPVGLGALSGYATRGETQGEWYTSLKKPSWQPPKWVFGPVWTTLYILMGVAFWRVWRAGAPTLPVALYAVQLVLNVAWSFVFFKQHNLTLALANILALVAAIIATVAAFYDTDRTAGLLLLPYLAWTAFATGLTARLYSLNPGRR